MRVCGIKALPRPVRSDLEDPGRPRHARLWPWSEQLYPSTLVLYTWSHGVFSEFQRDRSIHTYLQNWNPSFYAIRRFSHILFLHEERDRGQDKAHQKVSWISFFDLWPSEAHWGQAKVMGMTLRLDTDLEKLRCVMSYQVMFCLSSWGCEDLSIKWSKEGAFMSLHVSWDRVQHNPLTDKRCDKGN